MNARSLKLLLFALVLLLFAQTHFAETVVSMLALAPLNLPPDSTDVVDGLVAVVGLIFGIMGVRAKDQAAA